MEFELFISKNTFLKEILKEIQRVETSLWEYNNEGKKDEIPHKIEYMQDLIVQILRILSEIEVEILLFKVEKSDMAKKIEEDLENLYLLLEKQKNQLYDIKDKSPEDISKILDGSNSEIEGFSENSQKIKTILETLESDNQKYNDDS
jgi:hypothetical protein